MNSKFNTKRFGNLRYRGIAVVWTTILLLLIILMIGLALDTAKVFHVAQELQHTADAASLAGAQYVKVDPNLARLKAKQIGALNIAYGESVNLDENFSNTFTGDIVIGKYLSQNREFIGLTKGANAVMVNAKRTSEWGGPIPLTFGHIADVPASNVIARSVAKNDETIGAGLIALANNPRDYWNHPTGLLLDSGVVDVQGGDIYVNSPAVGLPWAGIRGNGNFAVNAIDMYFVGATNPPPAEWTEHSIPQDPPVNVERVDTPIADPFEGISPPPIPATPVFTKTINNQMLGANGGYLKLQPGYYPGGISITGGTLELEGGIYILGGGTEPNVTSGLVVKGNANLNAQGVQLYVTKPTSGGFYGTIDIGGTGNIVISSIGDAMEPPQIDGAIGICLWQDRDNHNPARIIGTSGLSITGTIYIKNALCELGGDCEKTGNQIIAACFWVHGNAVLTVPYDGRNQIIRAQSYLVWPLKYTPAL